MTQHEAWRPDASYDYERYLRERLVRYEAHGVVPEGEHISAEDLAGIIFVDVDIEQIADDPDRYSQEAER